MQKIQELIIAPLINALIQQKNRIFLWGPIFFASGIGLYFSLKTEPPILLGACLSFFILGALLWLWKHQDYSLKRKAILLCSLAAFLVCCGFTVAQVRTHIAYTPMLVKKLSPVGVTGTIDSIESLGERQGSRVVLSDLLIDRLDDDETPRKIRLKIRKDVKLRAGQRINILAGLNPASPPVAPGAFDFQQMAYFKGIGAVGFAYSEPEILSESAQDKFLETLRHKLSQKISTYTDEEQKPVLITLMTGQRSAIRDEDWKALRASGLAHLLAISGMHVGMVAGVLFFFSRLFLSFSPYLALHYPIKKWAAIIALIGACLYTLIVGATIPTQRALMMTGIVMIAILFDRAPFSLRIVALAAFVVLFFSPESLTSVSFQMSFAAVTALICFYEYIKPVWVGAHQKASVLRRIGLYLTGVSITTFIAGLATGLFALYHFQNYALYGMLANIIAVPLMAFVVMPVVVISYVLMPFGAEGLTLPLAEWGVKWILATAHWTAGLDGALLLIPSFPAWIFILMVLTLWIWMIWKGRLKVMMIPIFCLLIGLVFVHKQPSIQISSKMKLISVRDNDGSLWLSTGRKERYAADNWLRRNGNSAEHKNIWPKEGAGKSGTKTKNFPLSCDAYGCRGIVEGVKIAIAFSNKAWKEDCRWADLVISQTPVPYDSCVNADQHQVYVIDYFDVWRQGAHAIWFTDGKIKVKTVEQVRGKRLWTQTSANKKSTNKKNAHKKKYKKNDYKKFKTKAD